LIEKDGAERHTVGSRNQVPPEPGRAEVFIYVRLPPEHKERMWSGPIDLFLAHPGLSVLSAFSQAMEISAFFSCHWG
jgi:hypothetical protein